MPSEQSKKIMAITKASESIQNPMTKLYRSYLELPNIYVTL